MSDLSLRETRAVLWLALLATLLGSALFPPACLATDVEVTMFGPKQYLRTTAKFNSYSDSFPGVLGKGRVIIQNGDGNGNNLVKDAQILIDGIQVFDASKMNQPPYTLEAPISMNENNSISVQLTGEPGGYLTVQAATEITPDATSTHTIGIAGGTVSARNHLGDKFTLTIPPLALGQDTPISVSALPAALPSPIAQILYPGAVLGPSGLEFSLPVTVAVTPHEPLTIPGALLFSVVDSTDALPTANQTALTAKNIIQGEIYHFSPPISLGLPTEAEIQGMTSWVFGEPYTTPQDLLDRVNSLMALSKECDILGCDVSKLNPANDALTLLQKGAANIIESPLPADPCGQYTLELIRLEKAMDILACNACIVAGLDKDLLSRTCQFNISPQYLHLYLGETWQRGITATVLAPNGKQRSCPSMSWYSSNPNVVDLAAKGNFCIPTAVGPKDKVVAESDVWANCEGLHALSQVTACSLNGSWQGKYSGTTVNHQGHPVYFSGTITVPVTQKGTSVSAVIETYTFSGTNINGKVTLGPTQVPCNGGASTCPAGGTATQSSDCLTLSGSFYVDRPRRITGTFTVHALAQ